MYEEIQAETGLSKGVVSKAIKGLGLKGFIRSCNDVGTRRYLVRDPRLAMVRLREMNLMSADDFDDANYLLEILQQPAVADPLKGSTGPDRLIQRKFNREGKRPAAAATAASQ